MYHADSGDTLVQGAAGLPVFIGSMSGAVSLVVERIRRDARRAGSDDSVQGALDGGTLVDGDVFLTNDPYGGGTHLNDMKLVRPYVRGGRVWCHLASVGHFTDVGGAVAGNYNPAATDIHAEGVCLPPVRVRRGGVLDDDVVDVVRCHRPVAHLGVRRPERSTQCARPRRHPPRRAARRLRRRSRRRCHRRAVRAWRAAHAQPPRRAARRGLVVGRPPRQRRQLARAHRAAPRAAHRRRPAAPGLLRQLAGRVGPGQHLRGDRTRRVLRGAQAPVPRGPGQRRLPRAGADHAARGVDPGGDPPAARRRLHRDDPADHGSDLPVPRRGRPVPVQRLLLRDDQRAVDQRLRRQR